VLGIDVLRWRRGVPPLLLAVEGELLVERAG